MAIQSSTITIFTKNSKKNIEPIFTPFFGNNGITSTPKESECIELTTTPERIWSDTEKNLKEDLSSLLKKILG